MGYPRIFTSDAAKKFLIFSVVGIVGLLSDVFAFWLLSTSLNLPMVLARALAFLPATIVTWILNRHFTFNSLAKGGKDKIVEYLRYLGVQCVGIAISFAVFLSGVWLAPLLTVYPMVALALGSVTAMLFNFFGSKFFVFNGIVRKN